MSLVPQSNLSHFDAILHPCGATPSELAGPGDDPEAWARELADEGWRLWIPGNTGADTVIGGRKVRRYSLRRWTGSDPEPANAWGA